MVRLGAYATFTDNVQGKAWVYATFTDNVQGKAWGICYIY